MEAGGAYEVVVGGIIIADGGTYCDGEGTCDTLH